MRFFANGPNIPDELLEERDNGNVVFFCGAGVSLPAGLPGFLDLAKQVVEMLGAPSDAKFRTLLSQAEEDPDFGPSLDRVFNLLQHEYGEGTIDDVVSRLLRTPRDANLEPHSVILKLSRNAARRPQLVTTNFDLLFERAEKSIKKHVPPALPDLASGQPLEGIVYLHGRRAARTTSGVTRQGLVVSSADFGRAYLSDGWATRFVRDLLQNYVIVLLGYTASDPPVRYLLEGLHSRGDKQAATIYAFDQGSKDEVHERWRDRGVRPLAYPKSDPAYSALWDTLRAWANRADDPDAWRKSVVDLARRGPRKLQAYQRGQVASLIRTTPGANLFADADPPPPAEWLCVFDRIARYANPGKEIGGHEKFDPLSEYGLDDDPPRPSKADPKTIPVGDDLISSDSHYEGTDDRKRLAGIGRRWGNPLPPRLAHLARWVGKVADDPAVAWWASGYHALHSDLLDQIERRLERSADEFHDIPNRWWSLFLEEFHNSPDELHDLRWHGFVGKLKKSGWTNSVLRKFERATQPHLKSERPWGHQPCPPSDTWDSLSIQDLAHFKVKFLEGEINKLDVPSENLPDIFRIVRRSLERGSQLLADIETRSWRTATFHPENLPGDRHLNDADKYLHWVAALFDRLAVERPEFARDEVGRRPRDDGFFFDKLKIYAWMKPDLFSGQEAATGLLNLSDDGFWESDHRRELLHTLQARWSDFPDDARNRVEARIIAGSTRWDEEEDEDYKKRKSRTAATILGWLELKGCGLSDETLARLPHLRDADSRWKSSWNATADASHESRAGWVGTESDPSKIIDAPLSELIELAERHTARPLSEFKQYNPFQGLVEQRPFKAVAALSYEGRRDRFPSKFWETAISCWPNETSVRLRQLFAHRLARLPTDEVLRLRHYIPGWCRDNLPALARLSLQDTLIVWDEIIEHWFQAGAEATQSSMGEVTVAGELQIRSRRTYEHSINSPIGKMAETLFEFLGDLKLDRSAKIPGELRSRLEHLLQAPGEGSDHAVCQTTRRLQWIYALDPNWVRQRIVPLFNLDNSYAEPAWNGYLYNNTFLAADLFVLMKSHFLAAFKQAPHWRWDTGPTSRLHEFLVIASYWHQKDVRYVSFEEARVALQQSNDKNRAHAAWRLAIIVKEQRAWRSFGKPFIQLAWPREARFQSESTSRQFADMAEKSGNHFPDVVQTILPLLVPVEHLDVMIHRMKKDEDGKETQLAARFPVPMLALLDRLVPDDPRTAPYDLVSVLNMMAAAAPRLRQDQRWRRLYNIVN